MNTKTTLKRIGLSPRVSGVGGMVSFQAKFEAGLRARGIEFTHDPENNYQALLVIGATRQLASLRRARQRGIPVIQRLDGMNWLHQRLFTGPRHWLRAQWGNWLLSFTRGHIASGIVYQSQFVRNWWEREYGEIALPSRVIYNGVDLESFSPKGSEKPPQDHYRILLIEGSLMGGYDLGLRTAIQLVEKLVDEYRLPCKLSVAGQIDQSQQARWERSTNADIEWLGVVPHDQIPALNRSGHLLFSGDINAACPNSVIEALACGLPVVAFATGGVSELVTPEAGVLAPYGGDPWKLEPPNIDALAEASAHVLEEQTEFRRGARARAEAVFGLDKMVDGYLAMLERQL